MAESGRSESGLWEAFISVDGRPADPEEVREILGELGMSEDIEHISSQDGRYNIEAAPIGGQLFAHDNPQRDCTAF